MTAGINILKVLIFLFFITDTLIEIFYTNRVKNKVWKNVYSTKKNLIYAGKIESDYILFRYPLDYRYYDAYKIRLYVGGEAVERIGKPFSMILDGTNSKVFESNGYYAIKLADYLVSEFHLKQYGKDKNNRGT